MWFMSGLGIKDMVAVRVLAECATVPQAVECSNSSGTSRSL